MAHALTGLAWPGLNGSGGPRHEVHACHSDPPERYVVASVDLCHVRVPLTVAFWLLLASLGELVFHLSKKVSSAVPDSALLLLLGLLVGCVLRATGVESKEFHLDSEVFFLYLLPPVVFQAGLSLPVRAFFNNLGSILCLAVVGTLLNTVWIGLSVWGLAKSGLLGFPGVGEELSPWAALLFASLISAVDPVAVLSVFEAVHVNEVLYILIFGESLLNDAVSVVLYKVFGTFVGLHSITPVDCLAAAASFFVVSLGGLLVGLLSGVLACLLTRLTRRSRVVEPLLVFVTAYLGYVLAELFHLSGILAIATTGLVVKEYVPANVSFKSHTSLKWLGQMLSRSCEGLMFLFLGLSTVAAEHRWDTAFVLLSLLFCLAYRFAAIILQTALLNRLRLHKLSRLDQFIMSFSGLRGAIAYGLVQALDEEVIGRETKLAFRTATIFIVLITVFLQGTAIKPVVQCLKVPRAEEPCLSLYKTVFQDSLDHALSGMEVIAGSPGENWVRQRFSQLETRYVRQLLNAHPPNSSDEDILEMHRTLTYGTALAKAHEALRPVSRRASRVHPAGHLSPTELRVTFDLPKDPQASHRKPSDAQSVQSEDQMMPVYFV